MKTTLSLLLIFVAGSNSFAQSNFRHDLALKIGSTNQEKLLLEYRYHLNERWAFTGNLSIGSDYTSDYNAYVEQGDSTLVANWNFDQRQYYTITLGAIRKLNFMRYNFYHVGTSIGAGNQNSQFYNYWARYNLMDASQESPFAFDPSEPIESDHSNQVFNGVWVRTKLYAGADVPIVNRLSFNVELGGYLDVVEYKQLNSINIGLGGYVAGGLRYHFGAISEK